jgi:hypothetical protein
MKGAAALALLDQVVRAVTGFLPPGVRTVRTQLTAFGGLRLWAVPDTVPEDVDYEFWGVSTDRSGFAVESRGIWLPWGFGIWVPVPRRVRIRLEAVDALETVQDAVRTIVPTWPAADAGVRARVEGDDVVVWFHSSAGGQLPPPIRLSFA